MSIASGYKKFKKYILTSSGFQLVSHWTKANTLEFDDGKTAQDKLGAIDGISSSRESNSDKIAASTALVSELNSDLGGNRFGFTSDGQPGYKKAGADTVYPLSLILVLDHIKHFRERAITVKMDMDALWHPDRLRLATICFMLRDTISARVTGLLTM